jgi:hypothetical protein
MRARTSEATWIQANTKGFHAAWELLQRRILAERYNPDLITRANQRGYIIDSIPLSVIILVFAASEPVLGLGIVAELNDQKPCGVVPTGWGCVVETSTTQRPYPNGSYEALRFLN